MYLQQEYFKRHNIKDVPNVNHVGSGSLFFKTNNYSYWESNWVLMNFEWKESGLHPGKYIFNFAVPIHDGYAKSRFFVKLRSKEQEIEWENYEHYLINFKLPYAEPIFGDKRPILTAWEMFIFSHDGWLVDCSKADLLRIVYKSIDPDFDDAYRLSAYQEGLLYLSANFPGMLKVFKYEYLPYIQNYSHWLENVLK